MTKTKKLKQVSKLLILLIVLYSCNANKKKEKTSKLNLTMFSLSVDSTDQNSVVIEDTVESRGSILLNNWKDTVYFNFGYADINNLAEKDPAIIYHPYNLDSLKSHIDTALIDTAVVIFTNKSNYDIDEFRKQNVFFDSISGYRAKITVPRESRKGGITGVYFDSLRMDSGGETEI